MQRTAVTDEVTLFGIVPKRVTLRTAHTPPVPKSEIYPFFNIAPLAIRVN